MSYILDALRKADAERERDPARGIHAQPAAGAPARGRNRPAPWAWVAACACAAVVAGYFAWGRDEPVTVAVVPASGAPVVAAPRVALTTAPVAATPAPAPAQEPLAPAPVTVATSVSPPPPAPMERMVTKAVVAPRLAAPPQAAAVTVAAAADAPAAHAAPLALVATPAVKAILKAPAPGSASAPAAASPAAAAPAPAADRILAVAELPPDVQRDLPKLAITGGVHSDDAAQRMLIVGGKVMSEGQELAPGVLLEQIRPRSAVLRFRGLRYSVMY